MDIPKIYLEVGFKPNTVREVLDKLYSNSSYLSSIKTYCDENCKKLQCDAYTDRSFDDIYYICKTYFPEIDVKDVFHELVIRIDKNKKLYRFSFCGDIDRINGGFWSTLDDLKEFDAYREGISSHQHESIYNWEELFNMLNIKSNKDLTEYRLKYNK